VTPYRCSACGNKTRFDVVETKRVRSFVHFTLGGEATVEEEEVLGRTVEQVVCRWCGSAAAIEAGARPDAGEAGGREPAT
jgi:hypothetical protein